MTPDEIKSYFERLAVEAATDEPQREKLLGMALDTVKMIEQLEADNTALRSELEFYGDEGNWVLNDIYLMNAVAMDRGQRARKALGRE